MICLSCNNEKFEIKDGVFTPEINGIKIEVISPAYVCTNCQTPLMDGDQMNDFRKAIDEIAKIPTK